MPNPLGEPAPTGLQPADQGATTKVKAPTPEWRLPSPIDSMMFALSQEQGLNPYRKEHALYDLAKFQTELRNGVISERKAIQQRKARDPNLQIAEDTASILDASLSDHAIHSYLPIFNEYQPVADGRRAVSGKAENQQHAQDEKGVILETLHLLPKDANGKNIDRTTFVNFCLKRRLIRCRTNEEVIRERQKAIANNEIVVLRLVDKFGKDVPGSSLWVGFQNSELGVTAGFGSKGYGIGIEFSPSALQNIVDTGPADIQDIPPPPTDFNTHVFG